MAIVNKNLHRTIKEFIAAEQSSGIILLLCAIAALAISNSALAPSWFHFWDLEIGFENIGLKKNLLLWVNDGLMAIFFLLVGLEIKREIIEGELASLKKSTLPIAAALGGMFVPAIIYTMFNHGTSTSSGWGIPMATDIAFAMAALALLGNRVPFSLKIMLTALAIVDDLGAIVVIAVFYGHNISWLYLSLAIGTFLFLLVLNKVGIRSLFLYIFFGILLWYFTLESGIHATIAGVLLALALPLGKKEKNSAAENLAHHLQKPVSFIIMPIFALANTGFIFQSNLSEVFTANVSLGIIFGLVLGKPLGIFLFSFLSIKLKLAHRPNNATWLQILGIGCLGGIGFTMSIFIALLAFPDTKLQTFCKIAILTASLFSGLIGFIILKSQSGKSIKIS